MVARIRSQQGSAESGSRRGSCGWRGSPRIRSPRSRRSQPEHVIWLSSAWPSVLSSTCGFIVFLAQTPITPAVGYARFLVLPEHISPEPCCIRAIFRARSRSVHYSSNYGLNCVFHEIPKPNSILAIKFHFLAWITTYKKSSVSKLVTWSPLLSCKRAPVVRCSALPIPEGPSET